MLDLSCSPSISSLSRNSIQYSTVGPTVCKSWRACILAGPKCATQSRGDYFLKSLDRLRRGGRFWCRGRRRKLVLGREDLNFLLKSTISINAKTSMLNALFSSESYKARGRGRILQDNFFSVACGGHFACNNQVTFFIVCNTSAQEKEHEIQLNFEFLNEIGVPT